MRAGILLLLIAAGAVAVQAGASRNLLQSSASCPIEQCNNNACAYNSRRQSWTCSSCQSPLIPNQAKSACVCPAGQYPIVGTRRCAPCPKGFYCPRGNVAGVSTAKACPRNMVTVAVGAKAVTDCVNKPGFKFVRTATGVRADPCDVDTYSPGLAKQTQCTKCPPGFKTDPELVPGSQTTSKVCVAEPGYFVAGDTTVPCPQGEYNDKYDMATSCTPCSGLFDEEFAVGITTLAPGSTSERDCKVAEPGYVLVDEKKSAILVVKTAGSGYKLGGAKLCPQKYFCPGGSVEVATAKDLGGTDDLNVDDNLGTTGITGGAKLWTSGIPILCPGSMWTEDEGAKTVDECVARPGYYISTPADEDTKPVSSVCPEGSYKEEWNRATGCKSCEDPTQSLTAAHAEWESEPTIYINDMDPTTGLVNRQLAVRGSPDSCYIVRGWGTLTVRSATGAVTLKAQICPANSYGIDADRKYGRIATPCTPCPANMVATGTGNYNVSVCVTQPGYGYYNGGSQKCPKGTYSAGGDKLPCITCPTGTTTDATLTNTELADCKLFMAGYGNVTGIVAQCPLGTYGPQDRAVANETCLECTAHKWTPAAGAMADGASIDGVGCSLCASGYGDDTWDPLNGTVTPTCGACKNGLYGDLTRTNPRCQICPIDRTFSYAYGGAPDVVEPQATSPAKAGYISQCVTDFQQIVDGAFFINFTSSLSNPQENNVDVSIENIQSCVAACRGDAHCVAAHFNYDPANTGNACKLWRPSAGALSVIPTAAATLAWKTMPSTVQAQSDPKTKAMGSGLYSFFWDVNVAVTGSELIDTASLKDVATTSVQACLDACTNNNLCAGVSMTVDDLDDATITTATCKMIEGVVQPGNSLRTLTKTRYGSLQLNAYSA